MIDLKTIKVRGLIMNVKKKKVSQLNLILDEPLPAMSLQKLLGKDASYHSTEETSLDLILSELENLEDENAMSSFIDKYGSSTFNSLDELLAAHLPNPYTLQTKTTSHTNLFDGLDDLLGE